MSYCSYWMHVGRIASHSWYSLCCTQIHDLSQWHDWCDWLLHARHRRQGQCMHFRIIELCGAIVADCINIMGAWGWVNKVLDSRSKGLGFDIHYWPHVEVSGRFLVLYCLCLPATILVTWLKGNWWIVMIDRACSRRKCSEFSLEEVRQ